VQQQQTDHALPKLPHDLAHHRTPALQLRSAGGGAGGQAAKDALGNDVKSNAWLATHQKGDRSLAQGLKVGLGVAHFSDRATSMMAA
jgi:hypothetical protein